MSALSQDATGQDLLQVLLGVEASETPNRAARLKAFKHVCATGRDTEVFGFVDQELCMLRCTSIQALLATDDPFFRLCVALSSALRSILTGVTPKTEQSAEELLNVVNAFCAHADCRTELLTEYDSKTWARKRRKRLPSLEALLPHQVERVDLMRSACKSYTSECEEGGPGLYLSIQSAIQRQLCQELLGLHQISKIAHAHAPSPGIQLIRFTATAALLVMAGPPVARGWEKTMELARLQGALAITRKADLDDDGNLVGKIIAAGKKAEERERKGERTSLLSRLEYAAKAVCLAGGFAADAAPHRSAPPRVVKHRIAVAREAVERNYAGARERDRRQWLGAWLTELRDSGCPACQVERGERAYRKFLGVSSRQERWKNVAAEITLRLFAGQDCFLHDDARVTGVIEKLAVALEEPVGATHGTRRMALTVELLVQQVFLATAEADARNSIYYADNRTAP